MRSALATLLFVPLLLGACNQSPSLTEMRTCTVDADCIVVLSVCCGCGATLDDLEAINQAYEEKYRAHIGCEPGIECDGCIGPADTAERRAACIAGLCQGGVACNGDVDCLAGEHCTTRGGGTAGWCSGATNP